MAEEAEKPKEVKKKKGNAYVAQPFRHKDNFDLAYEVDQDVSDLPKERIEELVGKGLVVIHGDDKPAETDPPK